MATGSRDGASAVDIAPRYPDGITANLFGGYRWITVRVARPRPVAAERPGRQRYCVVCGGGVDCGVAETGAVGIGGDAVGKGNVQAASNVPSGARR